MDAADLPTLRLLGHGGMIDRLAQITTTAGAEISLLRTMLDTDEQREALDRLLDRLIEIDAVVALTRNAGYESALAEQGDPDRSRQHLAERIAAPHNELERQLVEWVVRVSPR